MPFFGVCVGFQLLYESSVESPGPTGLGVFPGAVEAIAAGGQTPADAVEHAWRRAVDAGRLPWRDWASGPWVYFVHSFAPPVGAETVAVCEYGGRVAALAPRGALWGAQFHPEKSGATGLALLANFVAATGAH